MSPFRANTGSDARIDGNENGVQLPVANAWSKTVPSSASRPTTGDRRAESYGETASARSESTVTRTTFETGVSLLGEGPDAVDELDDMTCGAAPGGHIAPEARGEPLIYFPRRLPPA